jgi:hypothetical protein
MCPCRPPEEADELYTGGFFLFREGGQRAVDCYLSSLAFRWSDATTRDVKHYKPDSRFERPAAEIAESY